MRAAYAQIRKACVIESAELGNGPAIADISLYAVLESHLSFPSSECLIYGHLTGKIQAFARMEGMQNSDASVWLEVAFAGIRKRYSGRKELCWPKVET